MTAPLAGETLVIATHNPGKLREIAELVAPFGVNIVSAAELGLPEPGEALRELHQPALDVDVAELAAGATSARVRLVLEELYLLELGLALRRAQRSAESGTPIAREQRSAAVARALPFALTAAQERARARPASAPASSGAQPQRGRPTFTSITTSRMPASAAASIVA